MVTDKVPQRQWLVHRHTLYRVNAINESLKKKKKTSVALGDREDRGPPRWVDAAECGASSTVSVGRGWYRKVP